jgi:hypothetical protein
MKWGNDPNQQLKQNIYDILLIGLPEENSDKITIRQVFDAIDEMIDKLIKEKENCD